MQERYSLNQTPEQIARDVIDVQLRLAGWAVQEKNRIDWQVSSGIAVRHYPTQDGLEADYVLFVDHRPVGGSLRRKKRKKGIILPWLKSSLSDMPKAS